MINSLNSKEWGLLSRGPIMAQAVAALNPLESSNIPLEPTPYCTPW
jgi:hypothetical protein